MNAFKGTNGGSDGKRKQTCGFCRTDLVVGICAVGFLSVVSLAAVSRGATESRWMVTLSNMKQLTAAWTLYARDNADKLTPLSDGGNAGKMQNKVSWVGGWLNFDSQNADNTNTSFLVVPYGRSPAGNVNGLHYSGLLGFYSRDTRLFVSPNEPITEINPGRPFSRVRSLSMNLSVGASKAPLLTGWQQNLVNDGYRVYTTMSDIAEVTPASTFVLITEHPDTINDAHFVIDMRSHTPWDRPSSLEGGGANLSFADGHVENWQWRGERFRLPPRFRGIDSEPVTSADEISDLNRIKAVGVSR